MGTLYLVATPIGNLEDITARSLRILKEVSLIAAEDTRTARHLLTYFDIHTPLTSYFEHNKLSKLDSLLDALEQGDVAVISEAGLPGLSDPGYELVRAARLDRLRHTPAVTLDGQTVELHVESLPSQTFTGKLTWIGAEVDEKLVFHAGRTMEEGGKAAQQMIQDLHEFPVPFGAFKRSPNRDTSHCMAIRNASRTDSQLQAPT